MPDLYPRCACCGGLVHASGTQLDDFANEIERILKLLWSGKNVISDVNLLFLQASQILKGVFKGYGKDFMHVAWNSPDFEQLTWLTNNCFHFSAAKNYQELRDLTSLLKDGDFIKSFGDFKAAADAINIKYNKTWLRTEYDTAIASAQMSSRWVQFKEDEKDLPMLQYQTVGDSRVRDAHKNLNGVKKPVSDSFWDVYYPPNGWNCRCDVIQVTGRANATPDKNIIFPDVPAMFRTNLAKTGLLFPPEHPYFTGIPDEVKNAANSALNKAYTKLAYEWIGKNIDDGVQVIELENFKTGKVQISRAGMRNIVDHNDKSEKLVITKLLELLPELKLEKSNVKLSDKPNTEKKIKRGVKHYNYYKVDINKQKYRVNTEVFDGYEKPYAVKCIKK